MSDPRLTPEQIQEWKRLADAATPGPWRHRHVEPLAKWGVSVNEVEAPESDACWIAKVLNHEHCIRTKPGDQNAHFIAASRSAVPALCDEVERLRAENDRLREALRQVQWSARGIHNYKPEPMCPICDQIRDLGHAPDCLVGMAMEGE
jgi:hypothetical protein